MTASRTDVVAISDCEQQRETLVIMLDPEFAVTAIPTPSTPVGDLEPRAVILSAGAAAESAVWSEGVVEQALQRWPGAGLVLVDAPEPVVARTPDAAVASWSDPFSVPAAASQVAVRAPQMSPAAALAQALHCADTALRPNLETTHVLAALVRSLSRHASSEIASRFLAEQLRELVDRLAWVDWFEDDRAPAAENARARGSSDLAQWLRRAVDERELRARCRGLDFDFRRLDAYLLSATAAQASVLARSLRAALLELPPGTVEVDADASGLHCRHGALPSAAQPAFALDVVGSLLRRVDARVERREGHLTIRADEAGDLHA